jgi:hypothetical protein
MTSFERFENRLPALLDELAVPRLPDYADDLFARTAATRQRPEWTFPERWIPMTAISQRFAALPRIPWRLGALVALLAVIALLATLVAGALLYPKPVPYGPAANGRIVFIDPLGHVVSGDPTTGTTKTLVESTGNSLPIYSRDGTRFAYLAGPTTGSSDLVVANADGSNRITLTTKPLTAPNYVGWSGTDDRLLVVDAIGRMLLFSTAHGGPPIILNELAGVGPVAVGNGYNFSSTHAFRPPNGEEIVFVNPSVQSLMAVRPDGTGLRTLIDKATSSVDYKLIRGADWSPDGTQLLVMLDFGSSPENWQLFILNADGSSLRQLRGQNPMDGYNSVKWSPDGTRIGFQWWTQHPERDDGANEDFHGIGVLDLATGIVTDLGPIQNNGFITWDWSPDGESILEIGGDGSGYVNIVNVATGQVTTTPWRVFKPITWQRTAR